MTITTVNRMFTSGWLVSRLFSIGNGLYQALAATAAGDDTIAVLEALSSLHDDFFVKGQ